MSLKIYITFFAGHAFDAFSLDSFVKPFKFSVFASHVICRKQSWFSAWFAQRKTFLSVSFYYDLLVGLVF